MSRATAGGRPTLAEALTALALTCGVPPGSAWLDAAVGAGLAEDAASATSAAPPASPVAGLTTWVLPAAACALVSTAGADADAATAMDDGLRDVAAALMVVRAPVATAPADEPPGEGLLLGHALAAGWLATELWASGVVGAPGTFVPTVAAVVGAP
ncbi:MAG: hypothetical protein ABJA89_06810 [Lapillicoccus sp.]